MTFTRYWYIIIIRKEVYQVGKHEKPKKPARQIDWLTILIGMLADLITGTILLILAKIEK